MSKKTDSNGYTLLFAIGMVLVVGALLAFTASSLSPMINANKRIEKQQNILYAMGVNENDETSATFISKDKVAEAFTQNIKKQLVISGSDVTENDKAYLIDIKKEQTLAKEGKTRKLPLFIGEKEGKTFYIAPIRGKGLWDAIWGYVAMDKNMVVQGVFFDHKGETPGLGANIKQRFFMDDFAGEDLMSNGVFKGITVSKSNADPKNEDKNDNEVDAIAGATITGDGVAAMIKSELALYVPYFKTLK
ncbi:Na+-transporting NADH:ubiquinone oxidoreductase subunit C [Tenacibaculum sp. MAR_2009_124]|uniref:Na(+)-translocating NADH-quinone reductase subunit C n=1 Tax=Tenacibaculum sp. MAR_2009_124 TaxID=1250059 RepID=UPI0008941FED|nr:Na(+)-translocating NADH-quinone reductase subunit C [Tenacibaculum sp. MAR_2009_124]SEB97787.1 Na+-transporting NADH:ubiquinone oxidoreductase subunit C [Tenacibaculum sp. MAR_2009_124]